VFLLNKKQAELLFKFDDNVAKTILSDFEYKIFCILRNVVLKEYGDEMYGEGKSVSK